jgi:hypothetical protein
MSDTDTPIGDRSEYSVWQWLNGEWVYDRTWFTSKDNAVAYMATLPAGYQLREARTVTTVIFESESK